MSQSGKTSEADVSRPPDKSTRAGWNQKQWFTTPLPIKHLFDKFPLRTYPPNELPRRGTRDRMQHLLYIFTTPEGVRLGSPSYNPSCLKWQAYLKFKGIPFSTVSSNNHASPTGVLPFLIPSLTTAQAHEKGLALPAAKLHRWALTELSYENKKASSASRGAFSAEEDVVLEKDDSEANLGGGSHQHAESSEGSPRRIGHGDMRYDAYLSLLDNRIRNAWLYFLYLEPSNFAAVAYPLYITSCSSNSLVRAALAYNLRVAAKSELLKQLPVVNANTLYRECDKALLALSQLLGDDKYFFAADRPGLFDASVFAYTNPLLDDGLGWQETRLSRGVRKCGNLVEHRERILKYYFS